MKIQNHVKGFIFLALITVAVIANMVDDVREGYPEQAFYFLLVFSIFICMIISKTPAWKNRKIKP